jgi:NADPH-dependent ferric siderophore reductase
LGCEKARIIAAGANMARALRQQALAEMNHPAQWIKASGYWLKGGADTVENYDR